MKFSYAIIAISFFSFNFLHAAENWKPIFNGENLNGWRSSPDNPSAFSVEEDGTLKASGKRAHLYYEGDDAFSNFELKLKVKTLKNANSGVFFNTRFQNEGWPAYGYEAQVNSSHKDPRKTGSLYGVVDCYLNPEIFKPYVSSHQKEGTRIHIAKAPHKDGQWFNYYLSVIDKKVTIKLNGQTLVEFTEPEDWSHETKRLQTGTIAIQAHDPGSTVFYKNIQLKILD